MRSSSVSGSCSVPTRRLSASTNTGRDGSNRRSRSRSALSKAFCDGCGAPGRSPSSEPRWRSERFEVERLRTRRVERGDEAALAGSGEASDDDEVEMRRDDRELGRHMAAIRAIAAVELHRAPADLVEHVRQRATALAAAPAIHQRAPVARLVGERVLDHARDVARDHRGAQPARGEGRIARRAFRPARAVRRRAPDDSSRPGDGRARIPRDCARRSGRDTPRCP